jgi:uridine phosphorylase
MDEFKFIPLHINATSRDLAGNGGIGRYVLLPGSDGRAKEIAAHFNDLSIKTHPRGHHLYLGTIDHLGKPIAVATIASGMGCPSMEIILHELYHLGAKRFLRVGTAGSLQTSLVKIGDIINVQAAVRDESTTIDYAPLALPALSSYNVIQSVIRAAQPLSFSSKLQTGLVHCKSSFYAREFAAGPRYLRNNAYLELLSANGVLATEMETATLFIQSQLYHYQRMMQGKGPAQQVLAGAILGIVSVPPNHIVSDQEALPIINDLIALALETIKYLAADDQITSHPVS